MAELPELPDDKTEQIPDCPFLLSAKNILADCGIDIIPDQEFNELTGLIYENFGIALTEGKKTLVTGRIYPLLLEYGLKSYKEYISRLKADKSGKMLSDLANRISTNHTAFFRENEHFSYLASTILPEITDKKQKKNNFDIRIWCAGCATGEEAYSLEITLHDYFKENYMLWQAGVLATDISEHALTIARTGIYNYHKLKDVKEKIIDKYFHSCGDNLFRVNDQVRKEVTFRRLNLMRSDFSFVKPFDIILCRNVMIYFDQHNRNKLVNKLYQYTAPGGYLLIGHSESISADLKLYSYIKPAVYKREGNL